LVIAALLHLGKARVTPERISDLRESLSAEDRKRILLDLPGAPAWLHPVLRAIASGDKP
jgi:hypothetical protein